MAKGVDPAVQRKLDQIEAETITRTTLLLIADKFLEQCRERKLAEATMRKKEWRIHTLAEPLHHRPISEISSAKILHLVKKIERSGRRETAKKLLGALSAVFRLAVVTLRAEADPNYAVKGSLLPPKHVSRAAITDETVFWCASTRHGGFH